MKSKGVDLIATERRRQIEEEGWTAEHDRQHQPNEIAMAGAAYVAVNTKGHFEALTTLWPWESEWATYRNRRPRWASTASK